MLAFALWSNPAMANNIQVSNVAITDQDSITKTANIGFDVSWENSWRLSSGPANWDAAWIFVKYHNGDNNWRHAKISPNAGDHGVPAGAEISVGTTGAIGMGVFVHRSADGAGAIDFTGLKLKWDYGADGVLDSAIVTVDVQAIEMVYVPEGAFYVGDGSSSGSYCSGLDRSKPFQVTSEGEIPVGNTAGEIGERNYSSGGGSSSPSTSVFPEMIPVGFGAFYCMKYEVSQGQYGRAAYMGLGGASSLSTFGPVSRQIYSGGTLNEGSQTPDRAYVLPSSGGTYYLRRYLSWVGLRPMSDFEYEKACRGPVYPVAGEYAWGIAVSATLPYTLENDGTPTESVILNYDPDAGNVWTSVTGVAGSLGPARVGMFAKASYSGSTSPRIQSGSGYWGIMDLTGNVAEPVMWSYGGASLYTGGGDVSANPDYTLSNGSYYSYPENRFRGSNGTGDTNIPIDWTFDSFTGSAGGSFYGSARSVSAYPDSDTGTGIRGVRSAP